MKLSIKRTFFIGLAFFSISAFWQLYDTIIPLILRDTFKLGDTINGVIMAMDNILALFLLPLFGSLSDRTDTSIGKRMPYIVFGTAFASVAIILLPIADNIKNLSMFITVLGFVLVFMGTYRSPAVALMPDLTPKPLRSKANAIINLMGSVGAIITLLIILVLVPKENPNYFTVFSCVVGVMIVSVFLLFITTKEKKLHSVIPGLDEPEEIKPKLKTREKPEQMPADVKKSLIFLLLSVFLWFTAYNAVTTAFSRYATVVWKIAGGGFSMFLIVATLAALVSFIPIGIISSKIGRKKVILAGIIMMITAFAAGALYPVYHWSLNIIFALTGIGWASINVNSYPMVVEMSKGSNIGKYTGIYYTFSMAAQIFTPIASGYLLEHVSYRTLFPYSAIFSLLALFTMLNVMHGDTKPVKVNSVIENFNTPD
ncbi:MAG: MFS transporter [Clostridiales bacterium GWF2_38_85]|nr:MAG: MFS transporter [Clostridiales bacterium GWF2_38_85]HBL84901.1 MFS transporter [Clostridiales bacterium]